MDIYLKKQELMTWLKSIEDIDLLIQIDHIKDKEVKKYYSLEEAKMRSLSKIEQWEEK